MHPLVDRSADITSAVQTPLLVGRNVICRLLPSIGKFLQKISPVASIPPKANDAYSTLPSALFPPLLSLPSSHPYPSLPSLRSRHHLGLIQLGSGERCKLPRGSGRSPAAKRYFMHFGLKNASDESNFKSTFTSNEKYVWTKESVYKQHQLGRHK